MFHGSPRSAFSLAATSNKRSVFNSVPDSAITEHLYPLFPPVQNKKVSPEWSCSSLDEFSAKWPRAPLWEPCLQRAKRRGGGPSCPDPFYLTQMPLTCSSSTDNSGYGSFPIPNKPPSSLICWLSPQTTVPWPDWINTPASCILRLYFFCPSPPPPLCFLWVPATG